MTGPEERGDVDPAFETELRDVLARIDEVPDAVKERARGAGVVGRAPEDSELLDLVYDSALDATIDLGCRATSRLLTFAGGVRLDVRVAVAATNGDGLALYGWTVPIAPREVGLRTEELTVPVAVDNDGVFRATADRRTRISFLLEILTDGRPRRFHTGWFIT